VLAITIETVVVTVYVCSCVSIMNEAVPDDLPIEIRIMTVCMFVCA
jgi:Na+-translocating ferredoxin:NAD+ oxidoreductase RnfE subunit